MKRQEGSSRMLIDGVKNIDLINSKVAILEDYDSERWNALAEKQNTKMFIQMVGRKPRDYEEVREWVRRLSTNEKSRCGNSDFVRV